MKVILAQMLVEPGEPRENLLRACEHYEEAKKQGADLVVFPEMVLPGYLLGDQWERPSFLRECLGAQEKLVALTLDGPALAFGGLALDPKKIQGDGRVRKFIAFHLCQEGNLIPPAEGLYPFSIKTLHPNYREFDDDRHFTSLQRLAQEEGVDPRQWVSPHLLEIRGKTWRIGMVLCEDGWSENYSFDPISTLGDKGIDILLNASSSPFTLGKHSKRDRLFKAQAKSLEIPLLYCNATGIQNNGKTIYTFDGDSGAYAPSGEKVLGLPHFESGNLMVDLGSLPEKKWDGGKSDREILHSALVYGTRAFLNQTGITRIVIGASGGIDSALAAAIYSKVLDRPEDLILVNMPTRFNSETTKKAAAELANNLGCLYAEVPIGASVELTSQQLEGLLLESSDGVHEELTLGPLVLENVQARDRSGRVLAAVAAAAGGAFTCNANKSETTVGYSTLYGDHAGFLANLADLWKGQVYDQSELVNEMAGKEVIPRAIFDVLPSAELSDAQNPEKGQGDPFHYPYHDALFRSWVEDWERKSPEEILESRMEGSLESMLKVSAEVLDGLFETRIEFVDDLERWWRAYNGMGLAKRIQAPPILAISRRAFGFDHRESQTRVLFTERYLKLKETFLKI